MHLECVYTVNNIHSKALLLFGVDFYIDFLYFLHQALIPEEKNNNFPL